MNYRDSIFQLKLSNTASFLSNWLAFHPVQWIVADIPEVWINSRRKLIALTILEKQANNKLDYFPNQTLLRKAIQMDLNIELPRVITEYTNSFTNIKDE